MRVPLLAGCGPRCLHGLGLGAGAAGAVERQAAEPKNGRPRNGGPTDRAGSANHTKNPENIKRALGTVKQFKSLTVGKYYHREIPAFGARGWNLSIPGTPTGGPFGKNAMVYHDELVTAEIGQIGTQFDGPGHIGVNTSKGMFMYNGSMYPQSYERGAGGRVLGMGPNGVENVGELGFVCRLVVLDAVAYRKSQGKIPADAEMLPIPKAGRRYGHRHGRGCAGHRKGARAQRDRRRRLRGAHTGQGNSWSNDRYKTMTSEQRKAARDLFAQGEPGFGVSACEYLGFARHRPHHRRHLSQ